MRQALIYGFCFLPFLSLIEYARADAAHLANLKKHYPYGLIGNDFGLLNEDDMAVNTCDAEPEPFTEKSLGYPYWQCFLVEGTVFSCDLEDFDESLKTQLFGISIVAYGQNETQEYVSRRAIDKASCIEFNKDWKRLVAGEKYVCLSGPYGGHGEDTRGNRDTSWIFDKFKTRKGCSSYAVGGCDLRYRVRQGCKVSKIASLKVQ